MTPAPPQASYWFLAIAALLLWRVYMRMRRLVGRQTFSPIRAGATVVIYPALILFLMLGPASGLIKVWYPIGGLAFGTSLGIYGSRRTQYEATPEGLFYTPVAHLGIALSLLFLIRVGYRLSTVYLFGAPPPTTTSFFGNALTLTMFGNLAGYYTTYAVGLLLWARRVRQSPPAVSP